MRPIPRLLSTGALIAVTALAVTGCSGGDDEAAAPVDRSDIVEALADDVIVPGYERLAGSTQELATVTAELCGTPDQGRFDAARAAWDEAQDAWASTAAYRLGPVDSMRLTARIAYAVDTAKIDALAADGNAEPVTPELLVGKGADLRGLRAVEHLLFTPTEVGQLSARACEYAASAAALSADAAEELIAAWVDGVEGEAPALDQLTDPGPDGMWSSTTEALEDLLNSSLSALTTVVDMQLGPASGETTDQPEPQAVDDGAAHRALDDIAAELASAAAVYGDATADPPTGLSALVVDAATSTSDEAIRTDLAAAIDAVGKVPPPLFDVDGADPDSAAMTSLVQAYQHALGARTALGTEVASLLGLTVSFSDADGDG